jgi:hypothetical protein
MLERWRTLASSGMAERLIPRVRAIYGQPAFSMVWYTATIVNAAARWVSACGAEVCQVIGAHIPEERWARIKTHL